MFTLADSTDLTITITKIAAVLLGVGIAAVVVILYRTKQKQAAGGLRPEETELLVAIFEAGGRCVMIAGPSGEIVKVGEGVKTHTYDHTPEERLAFANALRSLIERGSASGDTKTNALGRSYFRLTPAGENQARSRST